jgi:hypothetical protein
VEEDGTVMVLVTGRHGDVLRSLEEKIEPERAAAVVEDVAAVVPELDDAGGPCALGFGRGGLQPAVWKFVPSAASPAVARVGRRMSALAGELLANRSGFRVGAGRSPSKGRPVSLEAFLLWTAMFFMGHVVAVAIGLVASAGAAWGLVALDVLSGWTAVSFVFGALSAVCVLTGATYFGLGRVLGRRYGSVAGVWQAALAAVLFPAVLGVLLGGSFTLSALSLLLPILARVGASTTAPPEDALGEAPTGYYDGWQPPLA